MLTSLFFIFLLVPCALHSALAQTKCNIPIGSSLTPTSSSSWLSPSGLYAFGFYPQGENSYGLGITVAKIPEKTVVWTSNRDYPLYSINSTLMLTEEGFFVRRRPEKQSDDDDSMVVQKGDVPIHSASMLDNGNFVVCSSGQLILWDSFDHPTDTILPGQSLNPGQELVSSVSGKGENYSSGIFRLAMQTDGNLVQYPREAFPGQNPYWASYTFGKGDDISLNLDDTGNLCLVKSGTYLITNLTKAVPKEAGAIFLARNDADGIFRVYSYILGQKGNWSIEWENLSDKCLPFGICGLNGYCDSKKEHAECYCLPQFNFVDPDKTQYGCEKNFTSQICKSTKNKNDTNEMMIEVSDTKWEDVSYLTVFSVTKENCKQLCLEDCNCGAAIYENDNCRKKSMPLRYGRILNGASQILIKVDGLAAPINGVPVHPHNEVEKKAKKITSIIWVAIAASFFAFAIFAISAIVFYRIWRHKMIFAYANSRLGNDISLRAFTFAELVDITNGFREELGRGASGTVYKGTVSHDQKGVAVKKLIRELTEGEREFQTELKVIGRAHHRNLVQLIGYCLEGPNRLLVYEYMSNGSLEGLLIRNENRLPWDKRISIALGIAKGILYLHEECEIQIIHCDIKPHNILLDENMCAKICDFGLAKLLNPDQTRTYTGIRGTRGYVAPEWHRKSHVTVKVDVYSFGVVLLEIICCRKGIDWKLPDEEAVLEDWVSNCFEANKMKRLVGDEEVEMIELERMVKVGLWCIQEDPILRPPMKKVVLMLDGTVEIPVPPPLVSSFSSV